ncbi:polysaccharide deacetylase family protein [Lachnospiraceae bacterium 62-35]
MKRLYIAMYHYVRDLANSRYPAIKGLDYCLFKQQIEFFQQNFHVITMEMALEAMSGGDLPENAMLLTFDDGYIDHYTFVLPVLMEHNMQGSFFIPGKTFTEDVLLDVNKIHFILASAQENNLLMHLFRQMDYYRGNEYRYPANDVLFQKYASASRFDTKETVFIKRMLQTVLPESLRNKIAANLFQEFVKIDEKTFARELYMNREQIGMMKKCGMFIGLHGYDHYWLGNLSENEMRQDIEKALDVMGEFINKDSWVINYPYGSYNAETIEFIRSCGCRMGLTTDVRAADLDQDPPFEIPRLDTNDFPPKSIHYMRADYGIL